MYIETWFQYIFEACSVIGGVVGTGTAIILFSYTLHTERSMSNELDTADRHQAEAQGILYTYLPRTGITIRQLSRLLCYCMVCGFGLYNTDTAQ